MLSLVWAAPLALAGQSVDTVRISLDGDVATVEQRLAPDSGAVEAFALRFDGQSLVYAAGGDLIARSPQFEEDLFVVDVPIGEGTGNNRHVVVGDGHPHSDQPIPTPKVAGVLDDSGEVYAALVTGLRDYVRKNGFSSVVIGLSGGIDSALTCAIAVDALGPDAVHGVTMPTRYSSGGSISKFSEAGAAGLDSITRSLRITSPSGATGTAGVGDSTTTRAPYGIPPPGERY